MPILLFTLSKSDLKWLRYDQNRNIIACHGNLGRLDIELVGLDWLNEASILNFSTKGNLNVAQIGWVGGYSVIIKV